MSKWAAADHFPQKWRAKGQKKVRAQHQPDKGIPTKQIYLERQVSS